MNKRQDYLRDELGLSDSQISKILELGDFPSEEQFILSETEFSKKSLSILDYLEDLKHRYALAFVDKDQAKKETVALTESEAIENLQNISGLSQSEIARIDSVYGQTLDQATKFAYGQLQRGATIQEVKYAFKTIYPKLFADDVINLELADKGQRKGKPKLTFDNFLEIFRKDKKYSGFRYNLLANKYEKLDVNGISRPWQDTDEFKSCAYIERKYDLRDDKTHAKAMQIFFDEVSYHPIKELVNSLVWDGTPRIEEFLIKYAKAKDTPYTRDVTRLLFTNGIFRLYYPGIKADEMIILEGKQGTGKSTLIRWLAMNDAYYVSPETIKGAVGIETLIGHWIVEFEELKALREVSDEEAKQFLSRQFDTYRKPWGKTPCDLPRTCIFLGTTNNPNFLTDYTGNRRYLPVECFNTAADVFSREDEIRQYIIQCWAEAKHNMDAKIWTSNNLTLKASLYEEAEKVRDEFTLDDWRIGVIQSYVDSLMDGEYICIMNVWNELYKNSFGTPDKKPTKRDSEELGKILTYQIKDLVKAKDRHTVPIYGQQRCWQKIPTV